MFSRWLVLLTYTLIHTWAPKKLQIFVFAKVFQLNKMLDFRKLESETYFTKKSLES